MFSFLKRLFSGGTVLYDDQVSIEQLEERIVLDAAVANVDHHSVDQHVDATPQLDASHGDNAGNSQSHDAVATQGQTDHALNVVLISNATPNVDAVVKDVATERPNHHLRQRDGNLVKRGLSARSFDSIHG